MSIIFGVPTTQKNKKEEKFPNRAVLTISQPPIEKGMACKFLLSKLAITKLGLDLEQTNKVSLAIVKEISEEGESNALKIAVTTNIDVPNYRVTKSGTFSNKKIHSYVYKTLELNTNVEHNYEIGESTMDSNVLIFSLNKIID